MKVAIITLLLGIAQGGPLKDWWSAIGSYGPGIPAQVNHGTCPLDHP